MSSALYCFGRSSPMIEDLLERVDGRLALVLADVGHALEELRLDEELAVAVDLLEQARSPCRSRRRRRWR